MFNLLLDKERDIELRTTHILKELNDEKFKQSKMSQDINQLQQQLQEAKNGLLAAARLNDQLEMNQMTIQRLNSESMYNFMLWCLFVGLGFQFKQKISFWKCYFCALSNFLFYFLSENKYNSHILHSSFAFLLSS